MLNSWPDCETNHDFILCCPQKKKFLRAHSELEVARYALKTSNLMLHPEFMSRLQALPLEYTYGEYRQLYSDYGTHFIREATLGGDFEYTIVLNDKTLEKSGR